MNSIKSDSDHVPVVFTLKIRGGCDTYMKRDGTIGTAGKGALIQTDLASTLGVTQDQYLFVPEYSVLNDQGGGVMNISHGMVNTLLGTTTAKAHAPIILEDADDMFEPKRDEADSLRI